MEVAETTLVIDEQAQVTEQGVAAVMEAQAEEPQQVSHEVTIFAEPVFHIGSFTVTNSLLNSWVVVLALVVVSLALGKKAKAIPSRFQAGVETVIEGAIKLADSVTGDRAKTLKVFPFVFGVFLFVLVNNWLGLLPGVGSIGFIEGHAGEQVFVPLFRGATADLNTTLAMAFTSVIGANLFGVVSLGAWTYFNKFVNLKEIASIPRRILKDPTVILVSPIKFFVGLIEVVGEIAKIASLSLRLFGNIFAGEVLLASIAALAAFLVPLPFMFLEIIVGLIQALIFAMLTLVYFSVAASGHDEHHESAAVSLSS